MDFATLPSGMMAWTPDEDKLAEGRFHWMGDWLKDLPAFDGAE
jgi:hypothetical protein